MEKNDFLNKPNQNSGRKWLKGLFIGVSVFMIIWFVSTFWVEQESAPKHETIGAFESPKKALIVYDADPIANLDEQVCKAFGQVLVDSGWCVDIATVSAAKKIKDYPFGLYVFCANTYNFSPDWAITRYLKTYTPIAGKQVVAITLGSGTTDWAKAGFEKIILEKQGLLVDSKEFWLLKPNDEARLKENNKLVAVSMVTDWAKKLNRSLSEKMGR